MHGVTVLSADIKTCVKALKAGGKILICGNGGSAAMASHFAAELVVRYRYNRRALPCINLAADQAILTACANDLGYETVFARQVEAYGDADDVLIALSTSGSSANVLRAMTAAGRRGIDVIEAPRLGDNTAERQEYQLGWLHGLADGIEREFLE